MPNRLESLSKEVLRVHCIRQVRTLEMLAHPLIFSRFQGWEYTDEWSRPKWERASSLESVFHSFVMRFFTADGLMTYY